MRLLRECMKKTRWCLCTHICTWDVNMSSSFICVCLPFNDLLHKWNSDFKKKMLSEWFPTTQAVCSDAKCQLGVLTGLSSASAALSRQTSHGKAQEMSFSVFLQPPLWGIWKVRGRRRQWQLVLTFSAARTHSGSSLQGQIHWCESF